jgi:tetratricopeptide (TPR) repeat protein
VRRDSVKLRDVPGPPLFDVMLLGYRNDLARERVLASIQRLAALHPLTAIERDSVLPYRLAERLDHEVGLALCAELRQSGAQVRLVASEPLPPPTPVESPPPQRVGVRLLLLVVLLGVVGFAQGYVQGRGSRIGGGHGIGSALPPAAPERRASLELNSEAIALSEHGEFAEAVDRLHSAMKGEPAEPTLQKNLRAVLHNWAVAELNAGRPEHAADLANQALDLGSDARLYLVLGVAQSRQAEWERAQVALEKAVELGGVDAQTAIALGRVYQQLGNRERAVEMFQRARDLGVRDADFTTVLARMERELDAEWDYTELPSPHFTISFAEGTNYDAARNVEDSLERAYFSVGRKLEFYGSERTPVVLYDEEEFHDITQAPSWMGALYDGRIKLPVRGLDHGSELLDRTVRHEYAHAVVSQLTRGRCPVWLNEGVAIWAEEQTDGERLEWAQRAISDQELFHLSQLTGAFTDLPPSRVPVAYAQSYLAVRALLDAEGAYRVRALLSAIGDGMNAVAAFESVMLRSLADFEGDLVRGLTG